MPTTNGLQAFHYGNPVLTGWVVTDYNISAKSSVIAVANESGVVVARRYYDFTKELNVDAYVTTGTTPLVGSVLQYPSGVYWEVQTTDYKGTNKDADKINIKGIQSEGISLS